MSADTVPRDPNAYRPGRHFVERFRDRYENDRPPRHLDGEVVRRCIEDGEVTRHDGAVRFETTVGGVRYRLVVNAADRKVVTGYPLAIDETAARDSGRWSASQLADLREFIATDPRS